VSPDSPSYLTPEEVANLLRVKSTTVLRLAQADGTMPCVKLGHRTIRFPRERLLTWLRSREQGAPARPRAKQPLRSVPNPAPVQGVGGA